MVATRADSPVREEAGPFPANDLGVTARPVMHRKVTDTDTEVKAHAEGHWKH